MATNIESADAVNMNPLYMVADAHNIAQGKTSLLESLGSALTYGLASAVTSGAVSILNTGIAGLNWATSANIKEIDTAATLRGFDDDLGRYYEEHKAGADIAGFVAGSIIPGLGGIKILRLMQSGKFGEATAAATGLLRSKHDDYLAVALAEIKNSTNTFKTINADKLKLIATGVGSEALDAAAFEIAVATTMNKSPVLEEMSAKDLFWNGVWGMAAGGILGGAISAARDLRAISKATRETDLTDITYKQNNYLGEDAHPSQNIVMLSRSKFQRPTTGTDKQLQLSAEADNQADNLIGQQFRKLAEGDAGISVQLSEWTLRATTAEEVAENVANLIKAKRITMADGEIAGFTDAAGTQHLASLRGRYIELQRRVDEWATPNPLISPGFYSGLTAAYQRGKLKEYIDDFIQASSPNGVIKHRQVVDGVEIPHPFESQHTGVDLPVLFADFRNKKARDFATDLQTEFTRELRKLRLTSDELKKLAPPQEGGTSFIMDLRTGHFLTKALPGVVDLARHGDDIKITPQGLLVGDKIYTAAKTPLHPLEADLLDINARHVYHMIDDKRLGLTVTASQYDIPLLERALRDADVGLVYIAEGGRALRSKDELTVYLEGIKNKLATIGLERGFDDTEIAYRLNITREFLEDNTKGFIREAPTADGKHLMPHYAKLSYATDTIRDNAGHAIRGEALVNSQIRLAQDRMDQIFLHILKDHAPELLPSAQELYYLLREANREGAGATLFGFAHGEYGSLASYAERIGLFTDKTIKARVDAARTELQGVLAPVLRSEKLTAELSFIKAMVQRNPEKFLLKYDEGADQYRVIMRELQEDPGYTPAFQDTPKGPLDVSPEVGRFLAAHTALNEARRDHFRTLRASSGLQHVAQQDLLNGVLYFPPINTKEYKFFALVRQHDGIGVQPHVGVIVSSTAEGLSKKIDELSRRPEYQNFSFLRRAGQNVYEHKFGQTITKFDSAEYHKALGDYEYQLGLNDNFVDSALRRAGSLSDVIPPTGKGAAEKLATEFLDWHGKQEAALVREAVEHRYSATVQELRQLGARYSAVESSRFQDVGQALVSRADNPYLDYIKTMLNVSRSSEYAPWRSLNEWVENSFSGAFKAVREAFSKVSTMSEDEAARFNQLASSYGLGEPYRTGMEYVLANEIAQRPYLGRFISKAQAILSGTILQADPLNALNNIVGTPILYGAEMSNIMRAIGKGNAEIAGKLAYLRDVVVPGTNGQVKLPTTWKLLGNSIKMYFEDARSGGGILKNFQDLGVVSGVLYQHRQMLDDLTVRGNETAALLNQKVTAAFEKAGKLTGNKFAEEFTRFIAAASMKQLTDVAVDAGLMTTREASAYIQTFVNRVQGNYLASQRPIIFQGVLGQAIGLFQTYQFNLLQNLLRYAGTAESRAAIMLTALQGTIYGMQGMPAFHAINTHLVGNADGNPAHKDIYTAAYTVAGKEAGDWLMYGLASNALSIFHDDFRFNLYSRGDINPRHVTVLPVNPADVPIVKAFAGFTTNLFDAISKIGNGGAIMPTILQGIEHNGLNRPLAGTAQILQGYTTTSKGSLLSSIDRFDIANAARLLGGKPFDEAIALDALYRTKAYQAKDRARREDLGAAVKTTLVSGGDPTDDQLHEFMLRYAKSGGRQDQFSRFMIEQMRNANTSQVNKLRDKLNNPLSQGLMTIMGGQRLPDFVGVED